MFWQDDGLGGTVATSYLSDIISVINEVLPIFTTEPVVYFVMLGLVGAAIGMIRKIAVTRGKK